jgi:hypothetical protein
MMLRRGSGGSPSPAHRHRNPVVRLDRPRVPPATPRSTVAPPSDRDHEKSMTMVSASPADPLAASSAGIVAPLLHVPLTSGPRLAVARAGGMAVAGHARAWDVATA